MRFILSLFMTVLFTGTVTAQRAVVEKYIETYKDVAIREMKRKGVPAAIILAQGILETESGNSDLVLRSNNHFGIKCKTDWTGPTVYHDDDARGECFRKYESAEESYRDHSDFLSGRAHYASLFTLDKKDYKAWARGLKSAGYATNPKYPSILISTIERYGLQQYTLAGLEESIEESKPEETKVVDQPAEEGVKEDNRKAVFALKGTSLLSIAIRYNISLSRLMEYNGLQKDGLLEEDRWIYLQRSFATDTDSSNPLIHEVMPKEGLYSISKRYNIPIEEIKALNNLKSDNLQAGQKLIISR